MSFNFIAPLYDLLASLVFGQTQQTAQAALLPHLPQKASVLIVGGGTGWILSQVLKQCKPRQVLYLEASERMLELAIQRISQHPQRHLVRFRHGTEADLRPAEQFDIILLPFVVDLFPVETLQTQLLPILHQSLSPKGHWLLIDFVPTDIWWHRALTKAMYVFFKIIAGVRATSLPNWFGLMTYYPHLTVVAEQTFWRGFIVSRLYQRTE